MRALIVVDVQNDFCPGGSLAVQNAHEIVPVINDLLKKFDLVIFTKDWHCKTMYGFESYQSKNYNKKAFDKYVNEQGQEDVIWPDHCVEDTWGAEFHPYLDLGKCKKDFYIFKKGNMPHYHPYSGFGEVNENNDSELKVFLDERNVDQVFVCGLATDYCVKETAIDATNFGYKTYVILDACKGINADIIPTLELFYEAGVKLIDSDDLLFI